jgi:hypothetical protein
MISSLTIQPCSFSAEQHSASAMVTLSSIALLTEDDALVDAVVAEGDELDESHLAEKDPQDLLRNFKALWELHRVSRFQASVYPNDLTLTPDLRAIYLLHNACFRNRRIRHLRP